MNVDNIIKSLELLPNDQAVKVWFLLDFRTIDAIFDEASWRHKFIQRKGRVEPKPERGTKRAQVIAMLERGPV